MDFEARELERYQSFLIDDKTREVLNTPEGRIYSQYLTEENSLSRRINDENFRGKVANRCSRLKRLQEELLPRQRAKVFQMLRNL